jgi:hypothetical protein
MTREEYRSLLESRGERLELVEGQLYERFEASGAIEDYRLWLTVTSQFRNTVLDLSRQPSVSLAELERKNRVNRFLDRYRRR